MTTSARRSARRSLADRALSGDPKVCQWFALCDRPTVATISHPVLEPVPTCRRCMDRFGMSDRIVVDLVLADHTDALYEDLDRAEADADAAAYARSGEMLG